MTRLLASLLTLVATTLASAADGPVAVFECREPLGRDWPRTLVTYHLQGPGAAATGASVPDRRSPAFVRLSRPIRGDDVRLVDAAGKEQPFQLWRVKRGPGGMIATARVSFFASLPANGRYRYTLAGGKPAQAVGAPKVAVSKDAVTLDSGVAAIRLPKGGRQRFPVPLSLVGRPGKAGRPLGPIAGIRLADGRWVGGSYFATEPIEAVRHRQKYLEAPPTEPQRAAALAAAPKVTGYTCRVTERGPLFVEAVVRFTFDNGGYYRLTARVLTGDPAIRIDEQMDVGSSTPPGHPLYVVMSLTDGRAKGDGWRPDACYVMTTRRKDKYAPLETALAKHGFKSRFASLPVRHDQAEQVVTALVPHDPWSNRAHYFGLVDTRRLAADKAAPFVGVVPMHAGSWRAAHWVFPPKNPHMFQQLVSLGDGRLEMRWTIRAQPHSQNLLHTGEYDPASGLTGMRRLWRLVVGPFQYHDTLHPMRAAQGFVTLDRAKDWILEWDDETQAARDAKVTKADRARRGPYWHARMAWRGGDDRAYAWFTHYRQAQFMGWASQIEQNIRAGKYTKAQLGHIKRGVAAFCQLVSDPDFNTRASMTHQGNPNMPINRFFALPYAARLIPKHPLAKRWLGATARYLEYKAGTNTAPGGTWSELITYFPASQPTLVNGALVCRRLGQLDPAAARLVALPVGFALRLLSPPDPRFGVRVIPGFGHEGCLIGNIWTPAASLMRDVDPDTAAALAWAWDQQGRPARANHGDGFAEHTLDQEDLLKRVTPELLDRKLGSVWLPGFGAVLRSRPGRPGETYLALRQGYLASHSDANQGDFAIYAHGAPLTTLSLKGYAISQLKGYKALNEQFGWHSRMRFAKQSDTGGWPGGGPVSGVHRHFFSDSIDYLRAVGDYPPQRWTRQVLMLKSPTPTGSSYFVFRDSTSALGAGKRQTKWWTQRTLGKKEQVRATDTGFVHTSRWGPKLLVRFLQPGKVTVESRDASETIAIYRGAVALWRKHDKAAPREWMTINAVGPIAPDQDVLVAICPLGKDEAAPKFASLGGGAARIVTRDGIDYVFASPAGMRFSQGDLHFEGVSGAVRLLGDAVHLIVAEGAGTIRYKGFTLKAGKPVTKIISAAEIAKGGTVEVQTDPISIRFALDAKAGPIEQVAAGVRRQKLAGGVAYEFASAKPIRFRKDGVVFEGRRGGIVTDEKARTVRLVMLDGRRIGFGPHLAEVATGPYDLTFHADRVVGVAEGPARFLHVTKPKGLGTLPCVTIGGVRYAPGGYGGRDIGRYPHLNVQAAIVPLIGGPCEFRLGNLPQPPVFRAWQRW